MFEGESPHLCDRGYFPTPAPTTFLPPYHLRSTHLHYGTPAPCPSGYDIARPSLPHPLPTLAHACTIPPTPLQPPHTCTIRYHNGVPTASHRGPRVRTLYPLHQAVSVRVIRAPREVRALEAGAWRRVPRRGCDRARPAAIGRPPCQPAQSSSSGAAPRLQRCLCALKSFGPSAPFLM